MRHPPEGVLRRLLDEPAGVAAADREHVAGCDGCRRLVASMREDAELVHAALALPPAAEPEAAEPEAQPARSAVDAAALVPPVDVGPGAGPAAAVDVEVAWERQLRAATTTSPAAPGAPDARPRVPVVVPAPTGRVRRALRRPVAAGAAVAVVLAGAGAAAANDWLQIFRTERVEPVSFSIDDLNALPDLTAYGDVDLSGAAGVHEVAGAAAAEDETGLVVPEVAELPDGVGGDPEHQVGDQVSVTFTFSAERAARTAAELGEELPPPPEGADGSQVRLVAGPGVVTAWSESTTGAPDLVVGRAVAPQAFSSSGVPFEDLRDYLLSLPGLPPEVAAPLRTFNADGSTLPVPVPAERVTTSSARVGGVDATVLATRDRSLAAVVWVEEGLVTVVAGPLDVDEVLTVARGLR